jgi:hypothetical protein
MKLPEERTRPYLEAYEDWHKKLLDLHEVFIDGTKTPVGDQFKGLLNREARAFEKFQQARLGLLGIPSVEDSPFAD